MMSFLVIGFRERARRDIAARYASSRSMISANWSAKQEGDVLRRDKMPPKNDLRAFMHEQLRAIGEQFFQDERIDRMLLAPQDHQHDNLQFLDADAVFG